MDDEIKTMLDAEYKETLEAVSFAEAGSAEANWELKKLCELHKMRMEEIDAIQKSSQRSDELYYKGEELGLKKTQIKEGKKDRVVKIALETAAIVIPVGVSSYWMAKGLTFEEKGTFTSRTGQWLSSHLRLFKK